MAKAPTVSPPISPGRSPPAAQPRSGPRTDSLERPLEHLPPVARARRHHAAAGRRKGFAVSSEARPAPVVENFEGRHAAGRRKPGNRCRRAHHAIERAKHGRGGVNLVFLVKALRHGDLSPACLFQAADFVIGGIVLRAYDFAGQGAKEFAPGFERRVLQRALAARFSAAPADARARAPGTKDAAPALQPPRIGHKIGMWLRKIAEVAPEHAWQASHFDDAAGAALAPEPAVMRKGLSAAVFHGARPHNDALKRARE